MPKITEMFAFVAEDPPGEEGIIGVRIGDMMMMAAGADMDRVKSLEPSMRAMARDTGQTIRLLRFSNIECVKEYTPSTPKGGA